MQADYSSRDGDVGILVVTLEDQQSGDSVENRLRLDPWLGNEYEVIEACACRSLVICGAQAIVVVDGATLTMSSSVSLEYEEAETLDAPWYVEGMDGNVFVL